MVAKELQMKNILKYSVGVAACCCSCWALGAFTLDDIHYWVGEGTNKAAIVIDWNDNSSPASLCWGYRWNGAPRSATQILKEIAEADNRLHISISVSTWGSSLDFIGYDVNDNASYFSNSKSTDSEDWCSSKPNTHYWSQNFANNPQSFDSATWEYYSTGIDGQMIENGTWYYAKYIDWTTYEASTPTVVPNAAESPFGYSILSAATEAYSYNNSKNALGRPTTYMNFEYGGVVNPVNPSWGNDELYAIVQYEEEFPSYVAIEFDHRVYDDPQNPYSQDFIVFGNAFLPYKGNGSSYYSENSDPNDFTINPVCMSEQAEVEVSQDGKNWYSIPNAPYADGFAPTLGYTYDTTAPDSTLFNGNLWWSKRTDPTLPLPPALTSSDWSNITLAELCKRYNGSAGGTGYDISGIKKLSADETGRKWIKYVRIKPVFEDYDDEGYPLYSEPEIDAIADVAPMQPYSLWITKNFSFADAYKTNLTARGSVGQNGNSNFVNAAFDKSPSESFSPEFEITSFRIENGKAFFKTSLANPCYDTLRISKNSKLDAPNWNTKIIPQYNPDTKEYSIELNDANAQQFFKLKLCE